MKSIFLTLLASAALVLSAQNGKNKNKVKEKEKKGWEVSNPPGKFKQTEFTVTEGTWMNLDISPDGKEIIFDLLGDIYSMPVTGGEAKLLRGGLAFEVQPRFSPDGSKITFTSDASGGDNIWMMNRDGSNAKQVTKETFRLLNNAVWSADGNYIIARKHFTSRRSLGAGELWMYHFTGGEGIQLTKKKNDQQDLGEPCVSSDGKYVYYSEDVYPGGYFQYNKDPNNQIYVIKRYNLEKGENEYVTGGNGSAFRPQISKDGKTLAFVRRVREKSVLYLRNMETGEEWPVYDKLSKDQTEAWAIFGVYSNFQWLDKNHIIIWSQGKIWNIDITTSQLKEIPFTAKCNHKIREAVKFEQDPAPDNFTVKVIRNCVTAPNESYMLFSAIGSIWKKDLPNGKPEKLFSDSDPIRAFEAEPSFSSDGTEIVYVTWNDEEYGAIWKYNLNNKSKTRITTEKGIYRTPRFSPDGKTIVYQKESGNDAQGFAFCTEPGIYLISATGGKTTLITKEGENARFTADGSRIFYQSEGEGYELKSCDLNGNETRTHFTSKYTNEFIPSPDNKWIAYRELFKVYIAAFPLTGKTIDLSANTGVVPSTQVAKDAGINIHWSKDGNKLHWTLGEEYFTTDLKNRFSFMAGAPEKLPPMDSVGIKVNLVVNSDKPTGTIALTNARVITMKNGEVIENGTILVTGNKITAIGKSSDIKIPADAKVMDCNGKTIMPGFVDVHAHLGTFRQGLNPQKQWSYYANLAYGVTTTHDPSSNTEMVFSQSEMVKFGTMVGPRIFSTGTILYGADGDF